MPTTVFVPLGVFTASESKPKPPVYLVSDGTREARLQGEQVAHREFIPRRKYWERHWPRPALALGLLGVFLGFYGGWHLLASPAPFLNFGGLDGLDKVMLAVCAVGGGAVGCGLVLVVMDFVEDSGYTLLRTPEAAYKAWKALPQVPVGEYALREELYKALREYNLLGQDSEEALGHFHEVKLVSEKILRAAQGEQITP